MVVWLMERLRDLWLWPYNLLRDSHRRAARLRQTWHAGWGTAVAHLRRLGPSLRRRRAGCWLRELLAGGIQTMHLLLVGLFDLLGGPELCQLLMHLGMETTPLTAAEKRLARELHGEDWPRLDEVRIARGGVLPWIFKRNGGLAFATWMTIHLPDGAGRYGHGRANLPILMHELTHIYQYQRVGSRYLTEAIYVLIRTRRQCYDYGGATGLEAAQKAGQTYAAFNREQQAQIIQDYFTRQQQGRETTPYLPFLQQCKAGII